MKKTKNKIVLVALLIAFILAISAGLFPVLRVFAENKFPDGQAEQIAALLDSGNTFGVKSVQKINTQVNVGNDYDDFYKQTYDMSKRKAGVGVSTGAPQVTFITAGLNSYPRTWSNDYATGDFAVMENSILKLLQQKTECNIYVGKFYSSSSFNLFKIDKDNYALIEKNNNSENEETGIEDNDDASANESNVLPDNKIIDNSKHSLVLLHPNKPSGPNDYIYSQFDIMASTVVSALRELDPEHKFPRVNLIGHSRGGLTNLQYALDHPDLVDSVFSLGTPYVGSTSASIDYHIMDGVGHGFSANPGERDIIDPDIYFGYMNRWNDNYDSLYKNIKVHALGGYQPIDMLIYQIIYPKYLGKSKKQDERVALLLEAFGKMAFANALTPGMHNPLLSFLGDVFDWLCSIFPEIEHNTTLVNGVTAVFDLLKDEFMLNPLDVNIDFLNDGLVDVFSQQGEDGKNRKQYYRGFKKYIKRFTLWNSDVNRASTPTMERVTHNLEAMDMDLLSYIMREINVGNDITYLTADAGNGCVEIMKFIGKDVYNTLEIPEVLKIKDENGKEKDYKVVGIGDFAFENAAKHGIEDDETGIENVVKIKIPKTVTKIGRYAFANNKDLQQVEFAEDSQLAMIENGAFSNIPKMKSFTITDNVLIIEEKAFAGSGIESFTVKSPHFEWNGELLVNCNVTDKSNKIAIYANPALERITVPDDVKTLSAELFYRNTNIKTVDLNKTKYIGLRAFAFSGVTELLNAESVVSAGVHDFIGTPWLDAQKGDYVVLGGALLGYRGSESELVIPEGVTRIGQYCFAGSNIISVVLPSSLQSIGEKAFLSCDSLEWILLNAEVPPMLDGDCFGESVVIYVKGTVLKYYKSNVIFETLENEITTKPVRLEFYDEDGEYLGGTVEEYYSAFDKFLEAPSKIGQDFICWRDEDGNEVYPNSFFEYCCDSVKLTAYYEVSKRNIKIKDGDTVLVEYGQRVDFGRPPEAGKKFVGWVDNNGNTITNESGCCEWLFTHEIKFIEPTYEAIVYSITYETGGGEFAGEEATEFSIEKPLFVENIPELKNFGYIFSGWYYKDQKFTTTSDIYENITLTARWLGKLITPTESTTINDQYAVVDLGNLSSGAGLVFYIAESTDYVTFKSSTNSAFTNMRIEINTRNRALVLGIDSLSFGPKKVNVFKTTADKFGIKNGTGYDAIKANGSFDLYLTFKGTARITGGAGGDGIRGLLHDQATGNNNGVAGNDGGCGYNGGYGIRAHKVNISGYDENSKLYVTGGAGGNGASGGEGQQGSDGVNPPRGSFLRPIKGDNGANGGTGGYGGMGGNGGYAIWVTNSANLKVTSSSNYTFIGGRGGNGGNGGRGGAGGNGHDDTNASSINGVGDPGDGGNGGNGGKGGNGGNGSLATNAADISGAGGAGGDYGLGGAGGLAGEGGNPGNYGGAGKAGVDGSAGTNGVRGLYGTTAGNSTGTANGFRNLPYLYNERVAYEICKGV